MEIVRKVYLLTKKFPKKEVYGLVTNEASCHFDSLFFSKDLGIVNVDDVADILDHLDHFKRMTSNFVKNLE